MITITGVRGTAKELRPITHGWGGVHWWGCLPVALPFLGLTAVVLTVVGMASGYDDLCQAVGIIAVATGVVWFVSQQVVARLMLQVARGAPGGGLPCDWHIDAEGLDFRNPVSTARVDWAAIKAVEEEHDRFVFLLTPQNNPVLPKRQLAEGQAEALRALIAEVTASGRLGRGAGAGAADV